MPPLLRSHRFPIDSLYSPFQRPIHAQHCLPPLPSHLYFPFLPFPYLWVSAVPGGGKEARGRRTRSVRKGFDPSGGDPVHPPSRMPHPSYKSSFSGNWFNPCSKYADLALVYTHTLCSSHLQPGGPGPDCRASSACLQAIFYITPSPLTLRLVAAAASGSHNPHHKGLSLAGHSSVLMNILSESLESTPVV